MLPFILQWVFSLVLVRKTFVLKQDVSISYPMNQQTITISLFINKIYYLKKSLYIYILQLLR